MRFIGSLVVALFGSLLIAFPALAEAAGEGGGAFDVKSIAAGLAIGVAVFGGAFSQGRVGAATLESIGRNPGASGSLFTPMLLILAFIESLVIFALFIAMKLVGIF